MTAFTVPLMIAAVVSGAAAQVVVPDCSKPVPCLDIGRLAPLLQGNNATLFATADAACGGDAFGTITTTVTGGCLVEIEKPAGCECSSVCTAVANNITAACRSAIIDTYCQNAIWIEADLQVNLRNIFLHLLNDCNDGEPVDCPPTVPPFDPTICATPGPGPMATEPGSAAMPTADAADDLPELEFEPITSGGSLGEQNAEDAEAPVAEAAPEQGVADDAATMSAGAAAALAAAALLLV